MCYPASNDDASNDGNQRNVREPRLPLERHQVSENGGEKRRGGADGLVKRDREVAQRDVAENDGDAEDEAEGGDLEELEARPHRLQRHHLEPGDGDVAEQGAGGHVAHGEEDRVLEPVVAEEVLVQEEHPNVGAVPRRHQPDRE